MAEYALANAVINRLKHQKSAADEPHLSPIASLSSKEGALQHQLLQRSCHAHMTPLQLQVSRFGASICLTTPTGLKSASNQSQECAHTGACTGFLPAMPVMWGKVCHGTATRMTPASHAGEEAQIIMEEVAALLRNSASSAGGLGAEQMRRLDSARSSLMSDLEAAQSLGSERAGSAEGLDPAFLARLGQAPSAPMPHMGGEMSRPPHWSDRAWVNACPVPGQQLGSLSGDVWMYDRTPAALGARDCGPPPLRPMTGEAHLCTLHETLLPMSICCLGLYVADSCLLHRTAYMHVPITGMSYFPACTSSIMQHCYRCNAGVCDKIGTICHADCAQA